MRFWQRFISRKHKNQLESEQPAENAPELDRDVIDAVARIDDIPSEDKVKLALILQQDVESKGVTGAEKKAYIATAIAVLAGGALLYPSDAEAFCGSIQAKFEKAIISGLTDPFANKINEIFETFTAIFDEISGAASSLLSSTLTSAADAENTVNKAIADHKAKLMAAPPPDVCGSDTNKDSFLKASGESDAKNVGLNTVSQKATLADDSNVWSRHFEALAKDKDGIRMATNYEFAMRHKTTDIARQSKYSDEFILLTIGESQNTRLSQSFIQIQESQQAGAEFSFNHQQKIATNTARLQVASHNLATGRNYRGSSENPGVLDAFESEIRRTYGSESWRSTVRGYADPTPGAIELALQLAFQNSILLESVEETKRNNVALGTILMEMLDAGDSE